MRPVVAPELLTIETFRPCLKQTFRLGESDAALDLVLAEVEDLGEGYSRRAFSLLFTAPAKPAMPQAIYKLDNASTGPIELFLVPLGSKQDVFRYQAVFT
jgi:hypothetical protein